VVARGRGVVGAAPMIAQGIHQVTSNVEVRAVDEVPVAGELRQDRAVTVEVLYAERAYLLPAQARHLAALLHVAAEEAERR
jgi:hypothetical protein